MGKTVDKRLRLAWEKADAPSVLRASQGNQSHPVRAERLGYAERSKGEQRQATGLGQRARFTAFIASLKRLSVSSMSADEWAALRKNGSRGSGSMSTPRSRRA